MSAGVCGPAVVFFLDRLRGRRPFRRGPRSRRRRAPSVGRASRRQRAPGDRRWRADGRRGPGAARGGAQHHADRGRHRLPAARGSLDSRSRPGGNSSTGRALVRARRQRLRIQDLALKTHNSQLTTHNPPLFPRRATALPWAPNLIVVMWHRLRRQRQRGPLCRRPCGGRR